MYVVDLDGRGGGLVGLVEALQDRAHEPLGVPEEACGLPDLFGVHPADRRRGLGWVLHNRGLQVVEDLVHVVSGGLLLFAGLQRNASVRRGVVGVVSVVYLLVGVLGFVLPYLFGLLPHGYSVVDNLIHLVLGILGLLVYANSRLPEAERSATDPRS
jgi:GNAT superfamily N-acetyltransferase